MPLQKQWKMAETLSSSTRIKLLAAGFCLAQFWLRQPLWGANQHRQEISFLAFTNKQVNVGGRGRCVAESLYAMSRGRLPAMMVLGGGRDGSSDSVPVTHRGTQAAVPATRLGSDPGAACCGHLGIQQVLVLAVSLCLSNKYFFFFLSELWIKVKFSSVHWS